MCLQGVTVAILAGGLGTRVRPVLGDLPKLLAPLAGHPFIDYLLHWLLPHRPRQVVLCLGQGADQVIDYLASRPSPLPLHWEVEPFPMGTAGALRHAAHLWQEGPVLVMNGDTYVEGDLGQFWAAHQAAGGQGSLLCLPKADCQRYGTITFDDQNHITRFVEKNSLNHGPGWVNSGILLLTPPLLTKLAQSSGPSLERDFLATLPFGCLTAVPMAWPFIDFGTLLSFQEAQSFFAPIAARKGALPLGQGQFE